MRKSSKLFIVLLFALILTVGTYAFAAANTVDATVAGDGAAAITGYTITAVRYNLNATTPGNIDSVTFTTSPAVTLTTVVRIKLVAAGSTWYTCTAVAGTTVNCLTPAATVLSADNLRVIATN